MSGAEGWRIPVDFDTHMKQQEKRLLSEQRRPLISKASDLLGPGAAPYAVQEFDWNSDAAAFVGVYFGSPVDGQFNSPDDDKYWIVETFGVAGGSGFQRATEFFTTPPGPITPSVWIRHFYSPASVRVYTAWAAL